jgi:Carboxypeptidase regulatory-like domain/TonB-dependent Receptor Plug Domain
MPGFGRWPVLRRLSIVGLALCQFGPAYAQSPTGKIEGRVHDEAGVPIPGAQVYLVSSAFSGVADARGRFFINNIPAGTWTVRALFVGYRPVEVQGLRVLAGQTVTQNFELTASPLRLQDIEVTAADNVLVPRDEVTTKQRIDGEFADALPVDRITDVLALQPGVVQALGTYMSGEGKDTETGLSIRGGRATQNVVYIDGVPVQPGYQGNRLLGWLDLGSTGTTLTLGTNALEEASVTTGSTSAEFGNATAGFISMVTRSGGSDLRASIGLETDEVFGVNHGPGFNRLEAGLSGPLGGNFTLAVSGLLEGQQSVEQGFNSQDVPIFLPVGVDTTVRQVATLSDDPTTEWDERLTTDTTLVDVYRYAVSRGRCDEFEEAGATGRSGPDSVAIQQMRENYGLGCNGVRIPATPRTLHTLTGRLNYSYGTGSRVSFSLSQSRFQGHRYNFIISHLNRLSAGVARGFSNRSRLATLSWVQNLSKSAERALALDLSLSYQQDRTISGPLTTDGRSSTRDPWGGFILAPLEFAYDFDNFPVDDGLIKNVRQGKNRTTPRDPGNSSYDLLDQIRNNPYALYGEFGGFFSTMAGQTWEFPETQGVPGDGPLNLYQENRYVGKATVDWQADRFNRLKLGGELTRYSIRNYGAFLRDRFASDAYIEQPIRWSAFVEDRLDLGDVIVVGGLRYDWYHTRASRPHATDTLGNRYLFPRIASMPGADPDDPTGHFVPDRSHGYLSPHVQVAFPVTTNTNFRLSYSHQVQSPDFGLVLGGINSDLSLNADLQAFGSDLDFGKTIALEFGIRHAFSDDMVLDVAAYNRNIVSDPAARLVSLYDPVTRAAKDLRIVTNLDYGTVRGLDVRLDRRFGSWLNGTIGYAYQHARSTGSDPFSYINFGSRIVNEVGGVNGAQPPPQAILPTDDSRPHALTGALSLTIPARWNRGSLLGAVLSSVGVFSTFRYASGTAYTRCGTGSEDQSVMSSEFCIRQFPEYINTKRLPSYKEVNARVTKGFGLGRVDMTAYVDVRNVLNFKNVLQVFAVNGSTRNEVERQANLDSDLRELAVERDNNSAMADDGASMQLPADRELCNGWISSRLLPAAANCIYLIRAEQRYGNGDGMFTIAEQSAASDALYEIARGVQEQTGPGRRARIGVEVDF